jgi:hypothetical protein
MVVMEQIAIEKLPREVGRLRKKLEYIESVLSSALPKSLKKSPGNQKCHASYNKSDLAQLFFILMDESILFFDANDERANRSKMQEFIKTHFTFSGDAGHQTPILEISKQFSEAKGYTYSDRQLLFLDKLLEVLQQRRERIASR